MNKKFEKNQEKSRRRMLREEYEANNPRIPTEDELLENNSYWDIDYLEKANRKTNEGIKYWEERYDNASGNMGKWFCQLQIDKLTKKLHKYESKS